MTTRLNDEAFDKAADLLRGARHAVALTGAGSSTPSGIPDFRSAGSGLWTRYLPMEVASLTTFRQNPERFYEWLRPLASQMHSASPNPAHYGLAKLEEKGFINSIITQNIDGLLQRAGARQILEVHGSLDTMSCIGCYKQYPTHPYRDAYINDGTIPRCKDCKKILKPDAVLFEEQLPAKIWVAARQQANECDLMLVAGSSLVVMPVAGLPMNALENNAEVIIVNRTQTYIDDHAAVVLTGEIEEIIPALVEKVVHG